MTKTITLSVTTDDKVFDSSITIPIDSTKEQRNATVELWLSLVKNALDIVNPKY